MIKQPDTWNGVGNLVAGLAVALAVTYIGIPATINIPDLAAQVAFWAMMIPILIIAVVVAFAGIYQIYRGIKP